MSTNEALFEESSQGAVSAVTAIAFVASLVLTFGGILLSSYGFDAGVVESSGLWLFSGGLLATFIGLMLPFTFLGMTGK